MMVVIAVTVPKRRWFFLVHYQKVTESFRSNLLSQSQHSSRSVVNPAAALFVIIATSDSVANLSIASPQGEIKAE